LIDEVEQDRSLVGEDEYISVGKKMKKRIKIALEFVERERERE